MFEVFTWGIALLVVGGVLWGVLEHRDTLHPLVYTMPMIAFMYVFQPYQLYQEEALEAWFSGAELSFVQGLNFACIATFVLGCVIGSKGLQRDSGRTDLFSALSSEQWRAQLFWAAIGLGGFALVLYGYGLANVGGFYEAYSHVKGGGWASSGYLRDFTILSVAAIVLLFMSRGDVGLKGWDYMLLFGFLFPTLVHGLLSARRGDTFIGIAALVAGWYFTRNRRPSLWQVLTGGAVVGTLLLVLVTFRGEIYLGSNFLFGEGPEVEKVLTESLSRAVEPESGNEFLYGSHLVLTAEENQKFYWGTRYLTYLFVRPIPSTIWPTKYQDVGMEELLTNAGTLIKSSDPVFEEERAIGAAPGFIGDLYIEFSWGAVIATFALGWLFAFGWRRMLTRGGFWTLIYSVQLVLSLYLISQTVEAVLVRFLVMVIPTALAWLYARPAQMPPLWAKSPHALKTSGSEEKVVVGQE
jgi:hypothetical protein